MVGGCVWGINVQDCVLACPCPMCDVGVAVACSSWGEWWEGRRRRVEGVRGCVKCAVSEFTFLAMRRVM